MSSCDESNISKNYIVQSPTDFDILSACTGFYTNNIYNCTGDTLTLHSTTVSANTINATTYLSGGTNILDILVSLDNFTTGSTLIGSTAYFDRTDSLSAYTLDLSSLDVSDTYITAFTYDNANTFTISDNSGTTFNATINTVTGLTVNGNLSATTVSACTGIYTSNLYGCSPITVNNSIQSITSSATGATSFAFGHNTTASGSRSHAEGSGTLASGKFSHAEGNSTIASGGDSHAEGKLTQSTGSTAHAEGNQTVAGGDNSHAEGHKTIASGDRSHAEGDYAQSIGVASHAEGRRTYAIGPYSHAEGVGTSATTNGSHAEGSFTTASGGNSHAEGYYTTASGEYSHAEGYLTTASGNNGSHAEGYETDASGDASHAEGYGSTASGFGSHAEGQSTASGLYSHAEGYGSTASGGASHAEGKTTLASGYISHAEGFRTTASGVYSHSGGKGLDGGSNKIIASGDTSFIHFKQTSASGYIGAYGDQSAILGGNDHNIGTGGTSSGIFAGSGNTISNDVLRSVVLGGSNITGTTNDTVYVPNLNIDTIPSVDNSLTQILSRDSSDGTIKYRDVSSIVSAATSADTYVTGFTYDNANTFTISDNSGSTFNTTINAVTGLTSNGDIEVIGDVIVTGGTGNVRSKQFYVEGNLGLDWDFGSNSVTLGNVSDGTIINGTGLTVNSDTTINGNLSATTVSACTGIYTSNLYGCSPITVHDNLIMVDDSIIKATNGDGVLNLRFNSTNNVVQLDNDGGTYNRGWFFLEDARMQAGYQNNYYEAESNNLRMRLGTATTSRYLSGDADEIQLGENIPLSSDGNPFKVFRSDGGAVTLANSAGSKVIALNNGVLTANTSIQQVVALGATGGTLKTNNTAYLTQTGFIESGDDFEGILNRSILTADRTYTLPNKSGIVALVSDISADTFVTGVTLNSGNYELTTSRNDTVDIVTDLSILASDVKVTGGTYDINTGIVTFTNNSGGTFNVTGFTSGMTDTFVTGGTLNSGTLTLDRQNGSVSISGFVSTFTGNTSGDCITDLWVTNISGCSPVTIGTELIVNDDTNINGHLTVTSSGTNTSDTVFLVKDSVGNHIIDCSDTGKVHIGDLVNSASPTSPTLLIGAGKTPNDRGSLAFTSTGIGIGGDNDAIGDFLLFRLQNTGDSRWLFKNASAYGFAMVDRQSNSFGSQSGVRSSFYTNRGYGMDFLLDYDEFGVADTCGFRFSTKSGTTAGASATNIERFVIENGSLNTKSYFDNISVLGVGTNTPDTNVKLHVSGDTLINGGLTANTINLVNTPTLNNSGTEILVRNSSTGDVEYRDVTSISADTNTFVTGFTYDNINTFTISDNSGSTFNANINVLSATTISATTYFGDGSNLTGISTDDNYVTGGTFSTNTLTLNRQNGSVTITGFTSDSNTTITGFTYNDANTFTISDSSGSTFDASINVMTGLTINGESTGTTLTVNGQSVFSGTSTDVVQIYGSGTTTTPIFRVQGSSGELFSITDSLVGELFAVNDISGIPILQVYSDNRIILGDNVAPSLYTTAKVTATSGTSTSIYSVPVSAYTGAWFEYTAKGTTSLRAGNIASIFSGTSVNHNETTTTDIGDTSDLLLDVIISGTNATLTASATTSNWEIKTIIRSI